MKKLNINCPINKTGYGIASLNIVKHLNSANNTREPINKQISYIVVDSRDRNTSKYTNIANYRLDLTETYREADVMGSMIFTRTLEDWAKFDVGNRTKFDATISSGLAIMANQRHLYIPVKKQSKISVNFARYNNKGRISELYK